IAPAMFSLTAGSPVSVNYSSSSFAFPEGRDSSRPKIMGQAEARPSELRGRFSKADGHLDQRFLLQRNRQMMARAFRQLHDRPRPYFQELFGLHVTGS